MHSTPAICAMRTWTRSPPKSTVCMRALPNRNDGHGCIGAIMNRLQAMEVFTRIVDGNSLSAAAHSLNITRKISLTPDGAAYYERCARILADIEESERAFSRHASPRGKLKIDMPGSI